MTFEIVHVPDDVERIVNLNPFSDNDDPSTWYTGDTGVDQFDSKYYWDAVEEEWLFMFSHIGWRTLIHRGFKRIENVDGDGNKSEFYVHDDFPFDIKIKPLYYHLYHKGNHVCRMLPEQSIDELAKNITI